MTVANLPGRGIQMLTKEPRTTSMEIKGEIKGKVDQSQITLSATV